MIDIEKIGKHLQKIMNLQGYVINFHSITKQEMVDNDKDEDDTAFCDIDEMNSKVDIYINTELERNDEQFYRSIVHELCHVMCNCYVRFVDLSCKINSSIKDYRIEMEEKMINNIATAIINMYSLDFIE